MLRAGYFWGGIHLLANPVYQVSFNGTNGKALIDNLVPWLALKFAPAVMIASAFPTIRTAAGAGSYHPTPSRIWRTKSMERLGTLYNTRSFQLLIPTTRCSSGLTASAITSFSVCGWA